MILAEDGSTLWFKPLSPTGTRAADFRVQSYEGKPVLTWWQDPLSAGGQSKAGEVIMDSSYRQIAVVRAGNGYQPDLHEFQITPQGTALITIYDGIDCDLSSVGGPRDAAVADTLLQQIDLKTGLVMYEWHSLDHVALADSYASAKHASRTTPFDFFHINAVDVRAGGDLLVDARNTWAAYDVDPRSGRVRWRLGGKHSSFAMGPGATTAWQHDAREQPDGTITFFDNGATPAVHSQSRAIDVRLDMPPQTATLVRDVTSTPASRWSPAARATCRRLATAPGWSAGARFPTSPNTPPTGSCCSTRTCRRRTSPTAPTAWRGARRRPIRRRSPSRALRRGHGAMVYASWNGATAVASWRVLAGASRTSLAPAVQAPRERL